MWPESRTYVTPTPRFTVEEVLNGVVRRERNIALIKAVRKDIVDDFLANVDKLWAVAENKRREADREAERVARETVLKVYQILDDRGTYQQALGDVKALLA